MELARKRFRKNKNSNGIIAVSSDKNQSNEGQEFVQKIPTLVSEIFLEELRDVKLLKKFRLVCKSWNIAASKSLRACSVVWLKENSSKSKDFAAILRTRDFRSFRHFPSPFQNVHVEGTSFTEPTFINLVFASSFTCTSLRLHLDDDDGKDFDQSQLSLFLAKNKDSIVDLIITGQNNPGFELNETLVNDAVQLTSVKSLKITDNCYECTHIQFLENIMCMCKPSYLHLNILDDELFSSLLQQDQITHIKDLHLFCWFFSGNVISHLANTNFQLRTLSVFQNDFIYDHDHEEWHSFLENVLHSLMQFRTNLPIEAMLQFPKLQEIQIGNYKSVLSSFTPNNFPLLTKIIFDAKKPDLASWGSFEVPHNGVQYCVIEAQDMTRHNDGEHELFMLLMFVSRQFPNVTSLDFNILRFQSSTLTDICKAFPSLKTLKLDGECNFFSFAGFTTSSLTQGLPVEMIPRRESILDFKKLEVIKFGSKFVVSPDMIRHCLPRISKLKQIELNWNSFLFAPLFRDFVGHVDKIVISGPRSFSAEMVQLQKLLPNSVVML